MDGTGPSLFTKNELKDAHCCRLCGFGAFPSSKQTDDFINMYDKIFVDQDESVTLDVAINKYLPLKVSNQELYYPKVICCLCDHTLRMTITFFQKIAEGQKTFSKIINNSDAVPVAVVEKENSGVEKFQFSNQNPIVVATPRKRGRPRKDPNESKKPKPLPTVQTHFLEKPKRQSRRPPIRYADDATNQLNDCPGDKDQISQVKNGEDTSSFLPTVEKQQWQWNGHNQSSSLQTDTANLLIGTEFTALPRSNMMALPKLSVIMDGDEDLDSNPMNLETMTLITIDKEYTIPPNQEELKAPLIAEESTTNQDSLENHDSDSSIKTLDDVIIKKSKRGKKRFKRKSTKTNGKKFQCGICKKEFSHPSSIAYHRASAHVEEKKFSCEICKKAFSHKQLLTNHLSVHSEDKGFKCNLCPAKFKNRASLYTHNKSTHANGDGYTCDQCGFKFNLKSSLKAHMRIHTGEKPFKCEFCQRTFSQRNNMVEHRRGHTGERPYKCAVPGCNRDFITASQLRNHKVSHAGTKTQFLCSVCGRGYSHSENFKHHMRRHTGDGSLVQQCLICQMNFPDPLSLRKHWRGHTGDNPYPCDVCKKLFSDPSSYGKHYSKHKKSEEVSTTASSPIIISADMESGIGTTDLAVIGATEQIVSENVTDFDIDEGYVQILNTESLTNLESETPDGQQVIYLYPEDLSYYTITLADNQDAIEVRI